MTNNTLEKEKVQVFRDKTFRGRPISINSVMLSTRLIDINSVIKDAFCDNPKTLVAQFLLLLPDDAQKLRRSTIVNNNIYKRFIKYLTLEVETEIIDNVEEDKYIPNTLRFVSRKEYITGHTPYYSYRVAVLVNNDIYEDLATCSQDGKSLIEKVITAWSEAATIDYRQASNLLLQSERSHLILDNYSEDRMGHYNNVHYHLSPFARLNGTYTVRDDAFDYSKE